MKLSIALLGLFGANEGGVVRNRRGAFTDLQTGSMSPELQKGMLMTNAWSNPLNRGTLPWLIAANTANPFHLLMAQYFANKDYQETGNIDGMLMNGWARGAGQNSGNNDDMLLGTMGAIMGGTSNSGIDPIALATLTNQGALTDPANQLTDDAKLALMWNAQQNPTEQNQLMAAATNLSPMMGYVATGNPIAYIAAGASNPAYTSVIAQKDPLTAYAVSKDTKAMLASALNQGNLAEMNQANGLADDGLTRYVAASQFTDPMMALAVSKNPMNYFITSQGKQTAMDLTALQEGGFPAYWASNHFKPLGQDP